MKVLVINGNPKSDSFCRKLAERYCEGIGNEAERKSVIHLGDIQFDPILRDGYFGKQEIEPGFREVKELFCDADHIVFVYPNWWGVMPALLKGFLDRLLVPGVAFTFDNGMPVKLMAEKSASLLITMDVPVSVYTDVYASRGTEIMRHNILDFCGIEVKEVHYLGPIHTSSVSDRQDWLDNAKRLGQALAVTGA